MKKALLIAGLMLICGSALGSPVWDQIENESYLRFPPIAETLPGFSFEMAYDGLSIKEGSACGDNEAQDSPWPCILEMLAFLAELEMAMTDEIIAGDPTGNNFEFARVHGGRTWPYWHRFAQLCEEAEALGQPELLSEAALFVRVELEAHLSALPCFSQD